ncbi:unnamed protein product [Thelazia callipaeda]|uniref:Uncharacterized protein n=1 Tax=Thelazia callipaeda TaxID=103827 RepID=A0A0N5D1T9_THECL|nr:unnamed protein product [Thelazia callipaeda]
MEKNNPRGIYQFPRWRSIDALSASLVASRSNISLPTDSNLPLHRLQLMKLTEELAEKNKEEIHRKIARVNAAKMKRHSLVDSKVLQLDYKPWYDQKVISENIIRDSIADSKKTRRLFENKLNSKGKLFIHSIRINI